MLNSAFKKIGHLKDVLGFASLDELYALQKWSSSVSRTGWVERMELNGLLHRHLRCFNHEE